MASSEVPKAFSLIQDMSLDELIQKEYVPAKVPA